MRKVTAKRRKSQSGQEIIEFALAAVLLVPMLIGSVVLGFGTVRSIQVQHVSRDLANMYIHGADFSTYPMQQMAQRLSRGLNLQIGTSFAGNRRQNTGNSGDGLVTVSQIMYVGGLSSASCVSVGAANCTNRDSFVFTQRIQFGNGSLSAPDSLGSPATTEISTSGYIQEPIKDGGAKLPGSGQSSMQALWQVSGGGRAPLQDGQVSYVVEVYIRAPGVDFGAFSVGSVYARYFF